MLRNSWCLAMKNFIDEEAVIKLHDIAHEQQDEALHNLAIRLFELLGLKHIALDKLDAGQVASNAPPVWESLPNIIPLMDGTISLIGSSVSKENFNDVDILLQKLSLADGKWPSSIGGKDLHLVYDSNGPHGRSIPLYDVILVKRLIPEVREAEGPIQPGQYCSIGPLRDTGVFKFPAVAQRLLSGRRYQVHKVGDKVKVFDGQGRLVTSNEECKHFALAFWKLERPSIAIWQGVYDDTTFWIYDMLFHEDAQAHAMPLEDRLSLIRKYEYYPPIQPLGYELLGDAEDLLELDEGKWIIRWLRERLHIPAPFWFVYEAQSIRPGQFFKPLKTGSGYHGKEFFNIDDVYKYWAKGFFDKGEKIYCDLKYDGIRGQISAWQDGKRVKIFTEDSARDRSKYLGQVVKAVQTLMEQKNINSLVLDCELLWFDNGKVRLRKDMAPIWAGNSDLSGEDIRAYCFDILYYNGEDLHNKPLSERDEILRKVLSAGKGPLRPAERRLTSNKEEFYAAWKWASKHPLSEGMMMKLASSTYPLSGSTPEWAKCKTLLEIHVRIIGRRKKDGSEQYRCSLSKDGKEIPIEAKHKLTKADLEGDESPEIWEMLEGWPHRKEGEWAYGSTYAIKLDPSPKLGDIISVAVEEITTFEDEEGIHISWQKPRVRNVQPEEKKPDSVETALKLAQKKHKEAVEEPPILSEESEDSMAAIEDYSPLDLELISTDMLGAWDGVIEEPVEEKEMPPEKGGEGGEGGDEAALTRFWFKIEGEDVEQDSSTNDFVYQYHLRGLLLPEQVKEARKVLQGDEGEKLWKKLKLARILVPFDELRRKVSAADRGKVQSIIRRALDFDYPGPLSKDDFKTIVQQGNVHADLRFEVPPKREWLLGLTQAVIGSVLQVLDDPDGEHFEYLGEDKLLEGKEQWPAALKYFQPPAWMTVAKKGEFMWMEPGQVGATANTAACITLIETGKAIMGVQKDDFHELFLLFDNHKKLSGRFVWTRVVLSNGRGWLGRRPKNQTPYLLSHDKEKEEAKAKKEGLTYIAWNPEAIRLLSKTSLKTILPINWEAKLEPFEDSPRWSK